VSVYGTAQELHRDDEPRAREGLRDVVRFSAAIVAAAAAVLTFAALWMSTCNGSTVDVVACGTAQRTLLGFGATLILSGGGGWALVRAYQAWRRDGATWPWPAAAAFLLITALLVVDVGFRVAALG
jgi:hypothetical protein